MTEKKRILFIGEASFLNTGFSNYYRELLPRLAATNKYEIAEFGSYSRQDDPRVYSFIKNRWKFYGNMPMTPEEEKIYWQVTSPRTDGQPTNQFGEYKLSSVLVDFQPDFVIDCRDFWMCLKKDIPILTSHGVKDVQDIIVGDKVLTHTGKFQRVTKTFCRPYKGKMYKVRAGNIGIPIEITQGHPILAAKRKDHTPGKLSLPNFNDVEFNWIEVENLSKYDFVSFPRMLDRSFHDMSSGMARLFGYYAAEGCMMYEGKKELGKLKGVQFTFHANEDQYINDVVSLIKENFDKEAKVHYINNTCVIRVFGQDVAQVMHDRVPGVAGTKNLHFDFMSANDDITVNFLCGLMRGDGCINEERGSYCTKSRSLAWQVFAMLVKLGITPTFNLNDNYIGHKKYQRYIFSFKAEALDGLASIYDGNIPSSIFSKRCTNDQACFTLKNVDEYDYEGDVFNFTVEEDNSYVSSFILHNCEYQERSPFRKYFKWIIQPTVDSAPQKEEWIGTYESANLVLSYSDFGINTLKRSSPRIKVWETPMRPGIDLDTFRPMDRIEAKKFWLGCKDDVRVILSTMRNQSVPTGYSLQSMNGKKLVDDIDVGDFLLTSKGRFRKVLNKWSYKERKQITELKVFGNNIDKACATSEHKFHFENGKKSIGEAELKERIKMPIFLLNKENRTIDVVSYLKDDPHFKDFDKDWVFNDDTIKYRGKGKHLDYPRFIDVNDNVMKLFGWYCAEGWLGRKNETQIQFGINTNEQSICDEICGIIKGEFDGHVTINDDAEFDSRTLSWSNIVMARLFKKLFGNGSRNKQIPIELKTAANSLYLAASYLQGDGSTYNTEGRNPYILASSFSEKLAYDVRDILQSNGIFTTIGSSVDNDSTKYNLGVYGKWTQKLQEYFKHYPIKDYIEKPKGQNWKNNISFMEDHFLVPIIGIEYKMHEGPYFDFEVDQDHTYNSGGYACDNSRKLFPDLIDAFGRMKNKYKGEKVVDKAVLLLHSSWPDNRYSYDYPRHIHRLQSNYYGLEPNTAYKGIKNDVMQTFMCHQCGHIFAGWAFNLYNRPIENRGMGHKVYLPCQKCGANAATTPDTAHGFTREQLAWLYNCCDLYAQVSIAEGEGMPPNEAKACGKPVLVMDHSSMAEKGRFCGEYIHYKDKTESEHSSQLGGEIIRVDRHYYEPETSQRRCLPDLDDLADKMYKILSNDELRDQMGTDARRCAEENYSHEKVAKEWEYILDNIKPIDRSQTWDKPHYVIQRETVEVPQELYSPGQEEAFVDFLYLKVLRYGAVDRQGKQTWVGLLRNQQRNHQQVYDYFVNVANNEKVGEKHVNAMMSAKQKHEVKNKKGKIV